MEINYKNFRCFEITSNYSDVCFIDNELKKGDNLTISDHLDIHVYKGGENVYCDLVVYCDDSEKPYTLKFYSKENLKGFKDLISDIIKQGF